MCNLDNFHWKMAPYEIYILILVLWEIVWKVIAMWRSARNNQPCWFVFITIFNTIGILPIVYLILDWKKNKANKTGI